MHNKLYKNFKKIKLLNNKNMIKKQKNFQLVKLQQDL